MRQMLVLSLLLVTGTLYAEVPSSSHPGGELERWLEEQRKADTIEPTKLPCIKQPSKAVVHTALMYHAGRNTAYDWPGDLRQHLTQAPHNLSAAQVAAMSDAQVMAWHDNWHVSRERPRMAAPSSNCPGGVCPTQSGPRMRVRRGLFNW